MFCDGLQLIKRGRVVNAHVHMPMMYVCAFLMVEQAASIEHDKCGPVLWYKSCGQKLYRGMKVPARDRHNIFILQRLDSARN
jgi:hypothetical protein